MPINLFRPLIQIYMFWEGTASCGIKTWYSDTVLLQKNGRFLLLPEITHLPGICRPWAGIRKGILYTSLEVMVAKREIRCWIPGISTTCSGMMSRRGLLRSYIL